MYPLPTPSSACVLLIQVPIPSNAFPQAEFQLFASLQIAAFAARNPFCGESVRNTNLPFSPIFLSLSLSHSPSHGSFPFQKNSSAPCDVRPPPLFPRKKQTKTTKHITEHHRRYAMSHSTFVPPSLHPTHHIHSLCQRWAPLSLPTHFLNPSDASRHASLL